MTDRLLVRPAEPLTASIARLSSEGDRLRVFFPEYRPADFHEVVRSYGFTWDNPYWARALPPERHGDLAAELAHALLAAGFCVKGPRPVMEAALSGDYEPEPVRTIAALTAGDYAGWFRIWWHRDRGGALKGPVRKLPGSRWVNGRYVVVPAEHYAAVLDFAATYHCQLSPGALALAEQARQEEEAALVVHELPPAGQTPPPPLRPDFTPPPGGFAVASDLIDDDLDDED